MVDGTARREMESKGKRNNIDGDLDHESTVSTAVMLNQDEKAGEADETVRRVRSLDHCSARLELPICFCGSAAQRLILLMVVISRD